jgi:predicted acyltransferase
MDGSADPRRCGADPASDPAPPLAGPTLAAAEPQARAVAAEESNPVARPPRRLVSLDTFRGITIAAMILVNSPGGSHHVYALLQHANWNGWHPADLIFPAFLVIAGMAIPLSFARQVELGADRQALRAKILTRTRIIFGLGLLLNALPYFDWSVLRIPGVLQRIALCYGAAALLSIYLSVRAQALIAVLLLLAYWALLTLVPVPGHGAGMLLPGTDLGAFVDEALMGGHLLHGSWDPEGLLSTLPAIATTLAGVLAGHWLRAAPSARRCLTGLAFGGLGSIALGLLWNEWFPINKSLWTSSYAVFTAGTALLGVAFCYWLVDLRGYRRWATPFVIYGTNPILAYYLSSLLTKLLALIHVAGAGGHPIPLQLYLFMRVFRPLAVPPMASLMYAATNTLLWLGVMTLLYRRKIFVKI